jgi:hypothetical protein
MKILSYGHVKPKEKMCAGCGAVYEYLPRDVQSLGSGTTKVRNFVKCPVCGHTSLVDDVLIKHSDYVIFQDADRSESLKVDVISQYTHKNTENDYEISFVVDVGFDGPPIGESLIKMIQDSVAAVARRECSASLIPDDKDVFQFVEKQSMALTNIALSQITTRANIQKVKFVHNQIITR